MSFVFTHIVVDCWQKKTDRRCSEKKDRTPELCYYEPTDLLAGPVLLRPWSVCFVACVLCAWLKLLTHKVSGQECCLTSPETLAQEVEWPQQKTGREAKEADGVSVKLQLIKRPIGGEVLCEREVQGEVVSLQSILNTVCQQIWARMWFYDNNVNLKGFECPLWCFHKDALSGTNIWHRFISCESGEPKMLGKVLTAAFLFCGQKWSTVTNSESYSNCHYSHQYLSCSCSFSAVKSICSLTDFFCFSFFCHTFMFQIIKPIWISDKDNLRKIQNEF